jgi:hypothetical protein
MAQTWASRVGSEHTRKEPSRQPVSLAIRTSTPGRRESSTGLPQCRCIAHELLSVEGKYSLLPITIGLIFYPNSTNGHEINDVRVTTIARLDQGHRYTLLEVPGLTCPSRGSNPGLPRGKRAL